SLLVLLRAECREEMITKVENKMRQMHIPSFLAKRFTKDIPTLQRWQKS
ncbi:MAG: hypothetical protein ACD_28C00181G0013, partial [uncultured bacterium]